MPPTPQSLLQASLCLAALALPLHAAAQPEAPNLAELDRRLRALETEQTAEAPGRERFGWQIPGTHTQLRVGGFIKVDAILVESSTNNKNDFRTTSFLIPVQKQVGEDWQLTLHARQSRLWVGTRTKTELGPLKTHLEFDFFGAEASEAISNPYTPMLRHAYGQLAGLLAGQTWSAFVQPFALPPNLDCLGTTGVVFIRQAQLRYTRPLGHGLSASVSLENPYTDLYNPKESGAARKFEPQDERLPDLVLRLDHKGEYGRLSLALLGRQLRYDLDTAAADNRDTAYAFGANIAARLNFSFGNLRAVFIAGDGLGRYLSTGFAPAGWVNTETAADGTITPTSIAGTIASLGGTLAYEHIFTPKWGAAIVFSGAYVFVPEALKTSGVNESAMEGSLSLLYHPLKRLTAGVEYDIERRETALASGSPSAELQHRFQTSARVNF